MALEITGGGIAGSNLVSGAGTNSATFRMPASPPLSVESVVATVDNAAGGDTTALLTIKDQSGVVIATKRQDDTIPAGDTGTATFALRLDSTAGGIRFRKGNRGSWLVVDATGTAPSPPASGAGYGIDIVASGAGLNLEGAGVDIRGDDDINVFADHAFDMQVNDASDWIFNADLQVNADNFRVGATSEIGLNPARLGFFFAAPVVQQPTPVTLGDVIALLQAYGLAA